jgi:hypothetical protein
MVASKKQEKYEELEEIKTELAEQVEKLRSQLKMAEARLAAIVLTIEVWKSKSSAKAIESNPLVKELRGMTQVQALIHLAKHNGNNRFRISEAKKILMEAGVVKSKKNASTILFTTIQRSGKFVRVAPGEYSVFVPPSATSATIKQIA